MKILEVETKEGRASVNFTYKELCIITNTLYDVKENSIYKDEVEFHTLRRDITLLVDIAKDGVLTASGINIIHRLQQDINNCKEKKQQ